MQKSLLKAPSNTYFMPAFPTYMYVCLCMHARTYIHTMSLIYPSIYHYLLICYLSITIYVCVHLRMYACTITFQASWSPPSTAQVLHRRCWGFSCHLSGQDPLECQAGCAWLVLRHFLMVCGALTSVLYTCYQPTAVRTDSLKKGYHGIKTGDGLRFGCSSSCIPCPDC